jgi:glycosyltransferase involved in cell wall biosynthesis
VVADDADAIADALFALTRDDAAWERASEAGRAAVREHLGPDRCVAALREIVALATPAADPALAREEGQAAPR